MEGPAVVVVGGTGEAAREGGRDGRLGTLRFAGDMEAPLEPDVAGGVLKVLLLPTLVLVMDALD